MLILLAGFFLSTEEGKLFFVLRSEVESDNSLQMQNKFLKTLRMIKLRVITFLEFKTEKESIFLVQMFRAKVGTLIRSTVELVRNISGWEVEYRGTTFNHGI